LQNMTLKQKIGQMTQVSFHFFCFEMLFLWISQIHYWVLFNNS
jgi:flagellar biosynthesis/type III secretory pathway M-ring protein FliF/YscJ